MLPLIASHGRIELGAYMANTFSRTTRIGLAIAVGTALAAAMATSPALADSSLKVRRASEPTVPVLARDIALPMEAFSAPDQFRSDETIEIVAPAPPADSANLPGREDARPRVLHTGAEVRFKSVVAESLRPDVQPRLRPDWMLSHHIDVGQGNAALLEFSCGVVLIDTGGQETTSFKSTERLIEYLNGVFARRSDLNRTIALVVLTHPHKDHTLGVLGILSSPAQAFKIGSVVTNASQNTRSSGWAGQQRLIAYGSRSNIPVTLVSNETIVRSDGLTDNKIDPLTCGPVNPDIRVLWGTDHQGHAWARNENNDSVVVRVDFGESSFLFTGDMEVEAQAEFVQSYIRNPDIIDVDVYQVGHHGSKNGTSAALLKLITPEIAVIGSGNPADEEPGFSAFNFGHPNHATISLLSNDIFGVSKIRPTGRFAVGINGRSPNGKKPPRYQFEEIGKAVFSTGWDGDIIIAASASGEKIVQID